MLVDTNVILDVVENDPLWADWSQRQLDQAALTTELTINPVIYAELSVAYKSIAELESLLRQGRLNVKPIPREALFLAGKAFLRYRRRGGKKTSVLPDFFIGAHASVVGMSLLTRDVKRYRHYFPKLTLISP